VGKWVWLLGALIAFGCEAPLFAQQPTQEQANAIRQECRNDYQQVCAGVPTGGSAALSCLQQHSSSVSPGCQQALASVHGGAATAATGQGAAGTGMSRRQKVAMMRRACGMDYRRLCANVRPGGGAALACLRQHQAALSRTCQRALQTVSSGGAE
jgi:Cysteine rich repeat